MMMQFNRRRFLKVAAQAAPAFIVGGVAALQSGSAAATPKSPKSVTSNWMGALTEKKASDSPLYFGRFKEPIYFLTAPITWKPNPNQIGKAEAVEAPAGFVTDLASVPRAFFSLLRPDDDYAYAAIIHDYL